jgi:hypothetical protein
MNTPPAQPIPATASNPDPNQATIPINAAQLAHIAELLDVFGDQTYESLAGKRETMRTAAMVTYAYGQIDQARTELEHPN